MSYCRFSSDDWRSDFYAWADAEGDWVVQVAGSRLACDVPPVDPGLLERDPAAFAAAHAAQMAAVQAAARVAIDHPEAGAHLRFGSPGDAADALERLAADGLHLPAHVVAELRSEQADIDSREDRP